MPSATDFLPAYMTAFMNLLTTILPNFGSGMTSRFSAAWRRDMFRFRLFGALGAVFRAALLAVLDALRVEYAAQDVVAHARQILDAAAADHHHRMFLQVMALSRDIADDFKAVGQAHLGNLAKRRVRLLRRGRIDAGADAALLRALLQGRHLLLRVLRNPRLANELVDRRHPLPSLQDGACTPDFPKTRLTPVVLHESFRAKPNRAIRFRTEGRLAFAEDRDVIAVMLQ